MARHEAVDVEPLPLPPGTTAGTAPGLGGVEVLRYLPVLLRALSLMTKGGTDSFSTWSPWGKRWVTVSDQPPEGL